MSTIDPSVYRSIFKVKMAYPFDIAGFFMRFYGYMMNIGTVSMLTLAGYSFLTAGFVSSTIAISLFLVSPRISKLVDEYGQHRIVPLAALVTLVGLAVMLGCVSFHGPEWVLFVGAALMGFLPNPQALVRARWTYLVRSGRLGKDAPEIKTVFSYEGVIDDIGFMLGPPFAIAIATAFIPIAGLLVGGILFAIGVIMLTCARSTEPIPGWSAQESEEAAANEEADAHGRDGHRRKGSSKQRRRPKAIIWEKSIIRVLFAIMFFMGAFYGMFDTSGIALAEELGNPNIASICLMVSAVISMAVGFLFGMVHIRIPQYKQVVLFSMLLGITYGSMVFINSEMSFYVISFVAAVTYAPFLITANAACERSVPGKRLTEAITWINAGGTCGMALGPSMAGIIIDEFGSHSAFDLGGMFALAIPVIVLVCFRIIKGNVKDDAYEVVSRS